MSTFEAQSPPFHSLVPSGAMFSRAYLLLCRCLLQPVRNCYEQDASLPRMNISFRCWQDQSLNCLRTISLFQYKKIKFSTSLDLSIGVWPRIGLDKSNAMSVDRVSVATVRGPFGVEFRLAGLCLLSFTTHSPFQNSF